MPLSDEHKARMRAGRQRAAAERKEKGIKLTRNKNQYGTGPMMQALGELNEKQREFKKKYVDTQEFMGLTANDCPLDCTSEHCCIGGSLVIHNSDGTKTLVGQCVHPYGCGLSPVHKTKPEIVDRYNRARRFLEHAKIDSRK